MDKFQRIISVDFDGCLFTNKYPSVGEPIQKNILRLKEEQRNGSKAILNTNRNGKFLEDAVAACMQEGIHFDAINENLPEIIELYGCDTRKISATEYWDDRAVLVSEQDIGDFSDGYHTFNDLYKQRLFLTAALFNSQKGLAWKSRKHADGQKCFGGGWFIVGIDTPAGPYTYHYENQYWDMFAVVELYMAPEWDGHTDKDVDRLMSLNWPKEKSGIQVWVEKEIEIACQHERDGDKTPDGEWNYGVACYESAMRAFNSLLGDGHSGFSIKMTQRILNRLIDNKPLTPIEDTDDIWNEVDDCSGIKTLQCKRMSSLFKKVYDNGQVKYDDVDSFYCIDIHNHSTYHSGLVQRMIDEMFPITMPYMPGDPIKVYCEDFLTDRKNGDFDTLGVLYAVKPNGDKVDISRFFKEGQSDWEEISSDEYWNRNQLAEELKATEKAAQEENKNDMQRS